MILVWSLSALTGIVLGLTDFSFGFYWVYIVGYLIGILHGLKGN